MATDAKPQHLTNGTSPTPKPLELAFPLPHGPDSKIHIHLTVLATTIVLFVTNSSYDSASTASSMGSFVYAVPDCYNPTQPLSTALYTLPSSLDFATRLAKVLARRTQRAVHVGSSISFIGAANGGSVEEEMEGFRAIVEVVLGEVEKNRDAGT